MSQEASGLKEGQKKVLRGAFLVGLGTLTSRILGLLRDIALGALFDRQITDAWTVAFRIPNLFRRLFGEGSLSLGFIPVYIEAQGEKDEGARAQNLINGLYTFFLLFWGLVTLLALIYSEGLFKILLSEAFLGDAEKWALTLRLGRIMLGFIYFICTYGYFMGILNALGSFGWAAFAPALLNISMLIFTFMPPRWFPQVGDGLAWGVLVGGAFQSFLLWIILKKQNLLPKLKFRFWNQDVHHVLKNLIPGIIGVGLFQFLVIFNLYFASSLAAGSISYIYWADRLLELPLSLISVSLGTALLPTLSLLSARKDWQALREMAAGVLLMNLFLALPAGLGLFILAEPIVMVLFKRGMFSTGDVVATASILKISALSLIFISISRVVTPIYFSIKKSVFPALAAVTCLSIHLVLAPQFMQRTGIEGLMLANLLVLILYSGLLLVGLYFWGMAISLKKTILPLAKFMAGLFALGFYLQIFIRTFFKEEGEIGFFSLLFLIISAGMVYLGMAYLLKCEQLKQIRSHLTSARDS